MKQYLSRKLIFTLFLVVVVVQIFLILEISNQSNSRFGDGECSVEKNRIFHEDILVHESDPKQVEENPSLEADENQIEILEDESGIIELSTSTTPREDEEMLAFKPSIVTSSSTVSPPIKYPYPLFDPPKRSGFPPVVQTEANYRYHQQMWRVTIDILQSLGLEFFFIEGSLISIIRYGSSSITLPDFGLLGSDLDLDIAIRVDDLTHWNQIRVLLKQEYSRLYGTGVRTRDDNHCRGGSGTIKDSYTIYLPGKCIKECRINFINLFVNEEENYCNVQPIEALPLKKCYPFDTFRYPNLTLGTVPYYGLIVDKHGNYGKCIYEEDGYHYELNCPYDWRKLSTYWNGGEYVALDEKISHPEYGSAPLDIPVGGLYSIDGLFYLYWCHQWKDFSENDKRFLYDRCIDLRERGHGGMDCDLYLTYEYGENDYYGCWG